MSEPNVVSYVALVVSVLSLAITFYVQIHRARTANRSRYWLFAHEPFGFTGAGAVREAGDGPELADCLPQPAVSVDDLRRYRGVPTDGRRPARRATMYSVTQLNALVSSQLKRAQETNDQDDARRIAAFVLAENEWPTVCDQIQVLLDARSCIGRT